MIKKIVYTILAYFPLIFIYKILADPNNEQYKDYWGNYYWFISSITFGLIFLILGLMLKKGDIKNILDAKTIKKYVFILLGTSCYWGIMALLRLYLFFNIELYHKLISSADTWTVGAVSIIIFFIFLTAKLWPRK